MEIIFFLVPVALLFSVVALGAFFWASRNQQFEDLEGEAMRVLLEDN